MNTIETRNIGYDFKEYNFNLIKNIEQLDRLNLYLILPNYSMLDEYRKGLAQELGGVYINNIITIDDLALKYSNLNKNYISRNESSWIIKKIIEKNNIDLNSSIGSAKSILNYIYELKSNEISYKNLKSNNNYLLDDISVLYSLYEDFLKANNIGDEIDLYLDASSNISDKSSNLEFIFYGFIEFRPNEFKIIKRLMNYSKNIVIEYPFLTKSHNTKTEKFLEKVKRAGFKENRQLKFNTINQSFTYELFSTDKGIYPIEHEVVKASNVYYELSEIFNIISKLSNKCDFSDISIIIDDSYEHIIKAVADEFKIPVSLTNAKKIKDFYLVRDLINFLNFYKNDEKKYLINLVYDKNFILDEFNTDELDLIINNLREYNYKNIYSYKSSEENLDNFLNYVKKKLYEFKSNPIKFLRTTYSNESLKLKFYEDYGYYNDLNILSEFIKSIEIIDELLFKVENFSSILDLETEDIADLLIEILNSETYYDRTFDKSVKILNPINSIGVNSKYRFIVGLNYNYPKVFNKNIIDNKSLKDFHTSIGLDLESRAEKVDNIKLQYQEVLSHSEKYVFSYIFDDIELIENKSFLLNESLSKLDSNYKKEIITKSILNEKTNSGRSEFFKDAFNNEIDKINVSHLDDIETDYLNTVIKNEYKRINSYKEFLGKVNKDYNDSLITYDATRIGIFNECPFHFYLKNELKYEPVLLDYDDKYALVKGNLYHKILEIYCSSCKDSYDENNESIYIKVSNILENVTKNENLDLMDFQKRVITNILVSYIKKDTNNQIKNNSIPVGFEKPVEYFLDEKIKLKGYIDRVDKTSDGVIITDYKSTRTPTQEEVKNLEAIQLPIYRLIYENNFKEKVIKANYGLIEKHLVSDGFSKVVDKSAHQNSLVELIYDLDRKNRNGDYYVSPINNKVCKFCEYKDICRVGEAKVGRE